MVSKRLVPYIVQYHRVSDRAAWIDFRLPVKHSEPVMFRAVNVYCPTNTKSELRPEIVRKLYKQVSSAIVVRTSRYQLFVMGDFNGRLGKLDDSDYVNGVSDYVGRHGMGKRNHNGHYLLNFMCRNALFATNTAFLHRASHRTTYEGLVNVKGQSGKKRKVFTQIDYIFFVKGEVNVCSEMLGRTTVWCLVLTIGL